MQFMYIILPLVYYAHRISKSYTNPIGSTHTHKLTTKVMLSVFVWSLTYPNAMGWDIDATNPLIMVPVPV